MKKLLRTLKKTTGAWSFPAVLEVGRHVPDKKPGRHARGCRRSRSTKILLGVLGLVAFSLAPQARGQAPYASRLEAVLPADDEQPSKHLDNAVFQLASLRAARRTLPALRRGIDVQLDGATVEQALNAIARQAGLELVYDGEKIAIAKRVTLDAGHVPAYEALRTVLRGTGLDLKALPGGQLVLVRAPEVDPKMSGVGVEAVALPNLARLVPAHLASLRPRLRTGAIAGTVTDSTSGEPLPGVNVVIAGTQRGAATDGEGRFTISGLEPGTYALVASFIGYDTKRIEGVTVADGETTVVDIALRSTELGLEEVVVVGYGTQRKETLTGSVSVITGEEIDQMPVTNTTNTLGGKVPGVVSITTSGEPGYDGSTIRIRGNHTLNDNSPLVVVDGIPGRSLSRLNPQDIESISILKDATAAIYGSRAANGVILVTTKRGQAGRPQFNVTFNQGFNQPTRIPEMADAATYLTMLNEIEMYRDREPIYSEEEIQHYREGDDPWLYPNTDWFAEALKPVSLQTKAHMSVTGGTESVQYYLSLGGLTEDAYYRNSATRYNQYNFRSNIDVDVTDNIGLRFDVSGRLEDRNFPTQSAATTFRMLMRGKPHLPAYWPNGKPGPGIEYGQNPVVTGTDATGYNDDQRYYLQSYLALDVEVPWVEGLSVRGSVAYDKDFRSQKIWRTPWMLYTWDYQTYDENGDPVLQGAQKGYSEPRLYRNFEEEYNVLMNLIAEYQQNVGAHSYGILLGVERQTFKNSFFDAFRRYYISNRIDQLFAGGELERANDGSAGHGARQNFFTRVNYNYQDKYLFEFVARYDGSYIFPENKRYGFFPAFSAGWRISEEPFFRNTIGLFDNLKIRASWGQTGNDRIDEWQYLATYGFGDGYVFGVDREVRSLYQTRTPNPAVTWEVANQFDVGLEGDLLDGRLSFVVDYFNYLRTDILIQRNASVPQSTGLSLPLENIGEVASRGFDGSVTWRQSVSEDVSYDVTLNGGYATNEIRFWDEPPGAPEWQRSTGSKMNTGLYYKSIGVFNSWEEVEAYPHWEGARPGDIIFEDVDGDGEITADDRIRVNSNDTPTFIGGLTIGAQVRQFDFSVFFQGATGAVQYIRTQSGDYGNFFAAYAEHRWTPENPDSEHPRTFNRTNEYWMSNNNTYFLRDTDYIRLKSLQLGYSLPASFTSRLGLQHLRVYVSGFNLLTWDKLGLMDPEARDEDGTYYLQKRVYNAGFSVTF